MISRRTSSDEFSLTSHSLEATNPLRGLTLLTAVSLMEQAMRGEFAQVQWTLHHIIQTDPDLFALVLRRTSALCRLDWNIKVIDELKPGQEAMAEAQSAALRMAYERITNLNQTIEEMAQAFVIGFSIHQFEPDPKTDSMQLGAYKPWNILRDGLDGEFYWNPTALAVRTISGMDRIDPATHIIYVPRYNLLRIALTKFIRSNLSVKDWAAFVEAYGIPAPYIELPPNTSPEQNQAYLEQAQAMRSGADGIIPNGASVTFPTVGAGTTPFEPILDYLQKQLILAGTGGLLTMLAESGSGTLAGGAHADTFDAIAKGEAKAISEVFQKQFDRPTLQRLFPGQPILAYFSMLADEEQDVTAIIGHAATLATAGYQIDAAELSEKTGYKITLKPEPATPLQPYTPARTFNRAPARRLVCLNRAPADAAATDQIAAAAEADYAPLRARLVEILAMDDPAQVAVELKALQAKLPDVLKDLLSKPSKLAVALGESMIATADAAIRERDKATEVPK